MTYTLTSCFYPKTFSFAHLFPGHKPTLEAN